MGAMYHLRLPADDSDARRNLRASKISIVLSLRRRMSETNPKNRRACLKSDVALIKPDDIRSEYTVFDNQTPLSLSTQVCERADDPTPGAGCGVRRYHMGRHRIDV